MKRRTTVVAWWLVTCLMLLSLLSAAICSACGRSQASDQALGNDEWREALEKWLTLAYVEEEYGAFFGSLGSNWLTPDLYTTYATVGIMSAIGQSIDNTDAIVDWIGGLQTDEGCYRDPESRVPTLVQTYWAVTTLESLGHAPANADAVGAFVDTQRQENGLFNYADFPMTRSWEESFGPTIFAIRTIRMSGLWSEQVQTKLRSAMQPVHDYVTAQLASEEAGPSAKQVGYMTQALLIIEEVCPDALPAGSEEWVRTTLDRLMRDESTLVPIAGINNLLDVAEAIAGVAEAEVLVSPFQRDCLSDTLLPGVSPLCGGLGSGSPATLDVMRTYGLVALARRTGMHYPHNDTLLSTLAVHRLQGGWCQFVTHNPSSEGSFRALALARRIGCENLFDLGKLRSALCAALDEVETQDSPCDVCFAAYAYESAGGKLPDALREELAAWTGQRLEALSDSEDGGSFQDAAALVVLAERLGLHVEGTQSQAVGTIAEELAGRLEDLGVNGLYCLYLSERATWTVGPIPHREAILESLATLRTDQGLYRSNVESPIPDLDSTCRAVSLLEHLGGRDEINAQAVTDFVEACRMDCGFSIAPPDVLDRMGEGAYSDLLLTYEGLWLLDYCEKGQSSLPDICAV